MSSSKDAHNLRVAAYCRVSTDKEDQRNSLEAQQIFFGSYIKEHLGWTLVGVFADEGLSGTSTRGRRAFQELLRRAMDGEVDLILTKEVSRFARNTVDTLQVTRDLKAQGVGVLFLNDGIDTRENDGEFRLTIMASVAQEESRKISERTRWGQLQAMKRGVVFGNNSLYGYTLLHGSLTVLPEQAEIVRQVYHRFLEGHQGTHTIARALNQAGIPPPAGPGGAWSSTMVLRLLRNEKYCGDLLQKKSRTTDHLTHRRCVNDGTEETIYLSDHHEPILDRPTFEAVQAELARRSGLSTQGGRFSARYWYSGKIRCSQCGKSFTVKRTCRANGTVYTRFVCRGRLDGVTQCSMRSVRGELLQQAAQQALRQLPVDASALTAQLIAELEVLRREVSADTQEIERQTRALQRQQQRRERALEAYLDGALSCEEMRHLVERCDLELEQLQAQLRKLEEGHVQAEPVSLEPVRRLLEQELAGGEFVLAELVERITVYEDVLEVKLAEVPNPISIPLEGNV